MIRIDFRKDVVVMGNKKNKCARLFNEDIDMLESKLVNFLNKSDDLHKEKMFEMLALIKRIRDINVNDKEGKSMLYYECYNGCADVVEILLKYGASVEECDKLRYTPLHIACMRGNEEVVKVLLKHKASTTKYNSEGNTAIHLASYNGYDDIVKILLEYGANVEGCTKSRYTPLQMASSQGNIKVVEVLLKYEPDVNKYSLEGNTAVHMACYNGHDEVVKLLVDNEADVYMCDQFGYNLFQIACVMNRFSIAKFLIDRGYYKDMNPLKVACFCGNEEVVEYLINKGFDTAVCDEKGNTLLHTVSEGKSCSLVKILLDRKIDIDAKNNVGDTALHVACFYNDEKLVEELIRRGANLQQTNAYGHTPAIMACLKGDVSVLEKLIDAGLDISKEKFKGDNLLHIASEENYLELAELLLDKGVDVNEVNANGYAPIHLASDKGYNTMVNLLISKGADVDKTTSDGCTPLYIACKTGNESLAGILLDKGADVDKTTSDGRTLLYVACEMGNKLLVEILLDNGADTNKPTSDGRTPLYIACRKANMKVLKYILDSDSIDITKVSGEKFKNGVMYMLKNKVLEHLYKACAEGRLDFVKKLVDMIEAYKVCNDLDKLIDISTEDVVKYMVNKYNISSISAAYDKINPDKRAIVVDSVFTREGVLTDAEGIIKTQLREKISDELINACKSENYEYVKKLLDTGIVIEDDLYNNIVSQNIRDDIAKLLYDRKVKRVKKNKIPMRGVKKVYEDPKELFICAIKNGNRNAVRRLLHERLDPNSVVDENGRTALMLAIRKGDKGIVEDLLKAGANINAVDNEGVSVLMYAINDDNIDFVTVLINNQVDTEVSDNNGKDVIMCALSKGESMSGLINGRIDSNNANSKDKRNKTMLMYACEGAYMSAIKDIVSNGADVNAIDYDGNTALGIAAIKNNKEIMKYLIMKGAINIGRIKKGKNEVYELMGQIRQGKNLVKGVDSKEVKCLGFV